MRLIFLVAGIGLFAYLFVQLGPEIMPDANLPGLLPSLLPIVLPVALISTHTIVSRMAVGAPEGSALLAARQWTALIGNPNLALMASAAVALLQYVRRRTATREQTAHMIEGALMSAGVIILITAAGGAFGAMLRAAQIGPAIHELFAGRALGADLTLLVLAFSVSSLLKFAQGSSTVAMITAAGMMAAMIDPATLYGCAQQPLRVGAEGTPCVDGGPVVQGARAQRIGWHAEAAFIHGRHEERRCRVVLPDTFRDCLQDRRRAVMIASRERGHASAVSSWADTSCGAATIAAMSHAGARISGSSPGDHGTARVRAACDDPLRSPFALTRT